MIIKEGGNDVCAYHTETGEAFDPTQAPPQHSPHLYTSLHMLYGRHRPSYREIEDNAYPEGDWPVSQTTFEEGWVKDPEGKHRLWIPIGRRARSHASWFRDTTTLRLDSVTGVTAIFMF